MSTATLLAALSADVDWHDEGSCARDGADLFFARQGEIADQREALAKARCVSCPVLGQCLQWALASGEPSGVWAGGSTTAERLDVQQEYGIVG